MLSGDIKVSVIILTFNHEKYISQAIEGVLSQNTNFPFEMIIGDDASTDSTPEIINDYARRYPDIIRAVCRKNNLGPTRNGYECLLLARGEYLAACEGDDYWCDDSKLRKQVDFLDRNPDYSAVTHEVIAVDESGQPLRHQRISWISKKRDYTIKDFKGIFLPGHTNSMMRRNYFLNPDFDGTISYKAHRFVGDRTVSIIWASYGKIYRLPDTMSCYRIRNADNLTNALYKIDPNVIDSDFKYTIKLEQYAKETLKKDMDFDYHKTELLVSALIRQFKSGKSWQLMVDIIKSCKNKCYCLFLLPYIFLKKFVMRFLNAG